MTAGAGDGEPVLAEEGLPAFGYARCSRAANGPLRIDFVDEQVPGILGTDLAQYLAAPAGAELAAALEAVLERAHVDSAEIKLELSLIDPSGQGRSLDARVHGLRVSDEANATLQLRDLTSQHADPAQATAGRGSQRRAILSICKGADGRLRLDLVDDDIRRLVGVPADQLESSPAAAVIMARVAAILEAPTFSCQSPLADLTICDPWWGGRPLTCRFFRCKAVEGGAAVGLLIEDPMDKQVMPGAQARYSDGLLRLLRLSEVLLEHPAQKDGLARLADEIAGAAGFRNVAIARIDRAGRRLQVLARGRRPDRGKSLALSLNMGHGPCGQAIAERRTIVDRSDDGVCLYTPIEADDRVTGVLAIGAEGDLMIDGWQEEIVCSYADYVAAFTAGLPARPRALQRAGESEPDEVDVAELLTTRQQDVLYFLVETASSNRDIARALATTEATVKVHMRAILAALQVGNRSEALQLVYRRAPGWRAQMRRRHRENPPTPIRTRREKDEPDRG